MSTASKLAVEIESLLYHHTDRLRDRVDEALAPVRECLEGLRTGVNGDDCWCSEGDTPSRPTEIVSHSDACLAAQQLYERLKIQ